MEQTSVANLNEQSTYSSDDYVVVDDLQTTKKMKLSVIENSVTETAKTAALEYVEEHYSQDITENTQFNINGVLFKLTVTES